MKSRFIKSGLISLACVIVFAACTRNVKLITGSYSKTGDSGIGICDFDQSDGSLTSISSFNAGANPSYLCFNEKLNLIYAINEVDSVGDIRAGALTTIKHDGNLGALQKVNEIVVPNGGPCHISISPGNDYLLIANYGGGSVAVVKLDGEGIPVSVTDTVYFHGDEGTVSHAHMARFDPAGEKVYVSDLGLDRIWIFNFDRSGGKLIPFSAEGILLPKGTGPRHFTFNSSGTKLYVICELNSTVNVFNADGEKGLVALQTISTLKDGFTGENSCADIHISRSGKYLYGSNRGENDIVTYGINDDGTLKLAGHSDCGGNWPRNFTIDPSGKYLLVGNQRSDNIAVFKIDSKTGIPSEKVNDFRITAPACLKFK